jgi:hypothetical protein
MGGGLKKNTSVITTLSLIYYVYEKINNKVNKRRVREAKGKKNCITYM